MKPHSLRYKPLPATTVALAALRRGPLIRTVFHTATWWMFGRRRFSTQTINRLLESGEAVRHGDVVTIVSPPLQPVVETETEHA